MRRFRNSDPDVGTAPYRQTGPGAAAPLSPVIALADRPRAWLRPMLAVLLASASTWAGVAQHLVSNPPRFPFADQPAAYELVNLMPSLNFTDIIGIATPPGRTNELFVVIKTGRIYAITNLAAPTLTDFLDIRSKTFTVGECGLTGLAFHPNYAQNRRFFVFYTPTNSAAQRMYNAVSRFQTDPANPWRALPNSEQTLFAQHDVASNHQGGDLHFGPDGYLYVSLGDGGGGSAGATANAQKINNNLFAGILRLDVDEQPGSLTPNSHAAVVGGYRIPPDNPYVGATSFHGQSVNPSSVRTEFWAVGLRNPFRMSFDSYTGELYVGDVGEVTREEINRVVAGGNYGWNRAEGTLVYNAPPSGTTYLPPLYEYGRTGDANFQGFCVIGGVVYRGTRNPELFGRYIFADYTTRHVWALDPGQPAGSVRRLLTAAGQPVSFGFHPRTGEVLVVERSGSTGRISRLRRTPATDGPGLPQTLSATAVFSNLGTLATQEGVLPYEVNLPFWSDHAMKYRWFFFQDPAGVITRDASDRWTFPTGTVWVKHFELDLVRGNPATRRRLETRFLVKTAESVYGLTYRWRPDGSDADLVPDGGMDETIQIQDGGVIRDQVWRYPGRSECMVCHHGTAGGVLGFSTRQLNRNVVVAGSGINQLTAFGNLGVIQPPHSQPASLPRLSASDDLTVPLEDRFRSYLDVNCAYCHQPGGIGRGQWDGRLATPFHQAGILNGPVFDDLGIPGARVIIPDNLGASMIWQRISRLDDRHMPPLASSELNAPALELVRSFIEGGPPAPMRTEWTIGTYEGPGTPNYPVSAFAEFSAADNARTPAPGAVTRVPGDPQYSAANNPRSDDDYYFAGTYPAGFNGLTSTLVVPYDEPFSAWERSHGKTDPTNRIHLVLSPSQTSAGVRFQLRLEYCNGGVSIDGVRQPGFGEHSMVYRFRNGTGLETVLQSRVLNSVGPVVIEFDAAAVGATPGPNTIELVRTGPSLSGVSYWVEYDQVRLSVVPSAPPAVRTSWVIGTREGPSTPGYPGAAFAEFSIQNQRLDPSPGSVTRLPGDPQYAAASNPGADDHFYFAGTYPTGFNALTTPLQVPNDEPPVAWERAHSGADRFNRVHFMLSEAHLVPGARLRLIFEICSGKRMIGTVDSGFGEHDMIVSFRNTAGTVTQLLSRKITATGPVEVEFPVSAVAAQAGPNTIELNRTGPNASGESFWIVYDYLRLDSNVGGGYPAPY
ncbi:MAG: PQQ-dependent sugar dehydrogenase [Verrucomicrobiae bacterium]|nr:PQQ-dependent sugar dehydrogenase [Verrucomicrobiae bacterium]